MLLSHQERTPMVPPKGITDIPLWWLRSSGTRLRLCRLGIRIGCTYRQIQICRPSAQNWVRDPDCGWNLHIAGSLAFCYQGCAC